MVLLSGPVVTLVFWKNRIIRRALIREVLGVNHGNTPVTPHPERSFPGEPRFLKTGYHRKMLKRYVFSADWFCREKKVLDSCSGMGWGGYIVSRYADHVTAYDNDPVSIDFCRRHWPAANIDWHLADALDPKRIPRGPFDVVLCMETIEHFTRDEGRAYLTALAGSLEPGGILVGSSAFVKNRREARRQCRKNPHHLHIYTFDEISALLAGSFSWYKLIAGWLFVAGK